MIGWLNGILKYRHDNEIILDVNGVGYEIVVPLTVIEKTTENQNLSLFIHYAVREDGHYLYGFSSYVQRKLFRELIRVSGIGPKLGILILSGLSVNELIGIIQDQNTTALTQLPGIGKKTAERLIVELNDRVAKQFSHAIDNALVTSNETKPSHEAIAALIALELKPQEATKWVEMACKVLPDSVDSSEIIKQAFALKLKGSK